MLEVHVDDVLVDVIHHRLRDTDTWHCGIVAVMSSHHKSLKWLRVGIYSVIPCICPHTTSAWGNTPSFQRGRGGIPDYLMWSTSSGGSAGTRLGFNQTMKTRLLFLHVNGRIDEGTSAKPAAIFSRCFKVKASMFSRITTSCSERDLVMLVSVLTCSLRGNINVFHQNYLFNDIKYDIYRQKPSKLTWVLYRFSAFWRTGGFLVCPFLLSFSECSSARWCTCTHKRLTEYKFMKWVSKDQQILTSPGTSAAPGNKPPGYQLIVLGWFSLLLWAWHWCTDEIKTTWLHSN